MKTSYLSTALSLILFFSLQANGQLLSSYVYGPCDTVNYWYVWGAKTNYKTKIYWGDGTYTKDSVTAYIRVPKSGYGHTYLAPGSYTITSIIRFHDGTIMDSSSTTYSTFCSFVNIYGFIDSNTNCVRDSNERYINNPLHIEVDSAGTIVDTIDILGNYHYATIPGTLYKFKPINIPVGSIVSCPSGGIATVTGPPSHSTITAGFAFQCGSTSQYDLAIAMSGLFRPVATSTLTLHAYNNGCGSQNGTITLHLSKKYAYRSASRPPTGVSGNTITWNVSNLSIGNNATIYVYADAAIGTTLKVDDTICNTVAIAPVLNDVNLSNNTIYQCDRVRASFDPNDKGVFPSGDISPGTKLTYTINFENLGDDTAFNIYILDTLSDMLDAGSFQILHSSHAISHVMQDPPGGQKVVRFEFKNINLPYKNTPAFNKGFVQFSINAKSGLPPLTQINNRAGIYFDINPAVMTNSTENRVTPVAVSDIDVTAEYSLFPNPVKDILTVETEPNGFESLTLLNSMGQVVTKQQVTGRSSYINMMSLPAGLYYIQLIGREGVSTQKVEKL